ncbi:MAG TPA: amino acid racemase [Thermoanaerobaculia bacterium]|nr:amino acid racemase [Thermoanaerobaculia bacterium]
MTRIVGIIGGIAPESTIDYYRRTIAACRERDGHYPSILINSIDLTKMLRLAVDDRDALVAYLAEELERLRKAGAELGAFASNTPHIVFDEVQRASSLPLVSIVHAARDGAVQRGLRRVALLGTRFTMSGTFYPATFGAAGVSVVTPSAEEQTYIHDTYMSELVAGRFEEPVRERFVEIIRGLREREDIDGVVLAGTELPLLLRGAEAEGLTMLDTTALHVAAIVERMFR